jgi:hypothetical protein
VSTHAATAEHRLGRSSHTLQAESGPGPTTLPPSLSRVQAPGATVVGALLIAGLLCFVTFLAGGGLSLSSMTTFEIALTLLAGVVVATALLLAPSGTRAYGVWPVALLCAFTALTGLSAVWSVAPDASWQDAGRMLAYSGVLAASVAVVRIAPGGWSAVLGGTVLAAVAVCGYALLTKVFPASLDANDVYARLQEPYGYWNAIGLTAALGVLGCLWLGARRAGHALLTALAYPAMGLMIVTLMLAYSRGALVALLVGLVVWLCLVPLRLRGARVLIVGLLGAVPVVAWDFSRHALNSDGIQLASRTAAGHRLGALLVVMLVVLSAAGIAIGFFSDRRAPSARTRRAVGVGLAALLALALAGLAVGLAASKRGLTGTISHDVSSLTDPKAPVPSNTPGRLTSIGSVRARYWNEALKIFKAHPALGAGAAGYETARLRYRTETLDVRHAHGYAVQTLADLGIVGAAVTLALLIAWLASAGRATHPFNRRWSLHRSPWTIGWTRAPEPYSPERIGLLTMIVIVVVFGVHSFVDWTWYVPGNACVALLCAGWLAGRGPLGGTLGGAELVSADAPEGDPRDPSTALPAGSAAPLPSQASRLRLSTYVRLFTPQLGPVRGVLAALAVAGALLAAWAEWQPQRSVDASEQAIATLARNPVAARVAAEEGVDRDPLSAQALFTLSAVQHATGQGALARATLQKAVQLQPSNPQTWLTLGEYDLTSRPRAAVEELRAAVYLDPESIPDQNAYIQALRAAPGAGGTPAAGAPKGARRPHASRLRPSSSPPARKTSTSSKPKSTSRPASTRRV